VKIQKKSGAYLEPKSGEWVEPLRRGCRLACCSCGSVHVFNFRLVSRADGLGKKIQFRAFVDNRATARMRRYLKLGGLPKVRV